MPDIAAFAGPLLITVCYVLVYYGFQIHAVRVKERLKAEYKSRGERFDRYFGQDREMLATDRMQLNTLEHMPPFLVLLWLVAVFVGPLWATAGGVVYLIARVMYPFAMGPRLGRGVRGLVLVATVPGYGVLLYFCVALVVTLGLRLVG